MTKPTSDHASARALAQDLLRAWQERDIQRLIGGNPATAPEDEHKQQSALAGLIRTAEQLPHARNTLGMRAEGSTGSADCAGQILDIIDEPANKWPKPPTGYLLDRMLSEAAMACGAAPTGLQTLQSLTDDAFLWGSDRR